MEQHATSTLKASYPASRKSPERGSRTPPGLDMKRSKLQVTCSEHITSGGLPASRRLMRPLDQSQKLMAHRIAAMEVFRIPELCGLILEYLSPQEVFDLQNLTRASRLHLQDYKPWIADSIFHHQAVNCHTVKPVLAQTDDDDPKKVDWVYTSGPNSGRVMQMEQLEAESSTAAHYHGLVRRATAYTSRTSQMQQIRLNWLLQAKFPRFSYYPISNMLGFEEEIPRGYFINPEASFRPLLVAFPALSEVTIMDVRGKVYEVSNTKGVTMGNIVDAMQEDQPPLS